VSDEPDWSALLADAPEVAPLTAVRHLSGPISQSFSRPHIYVASDGNEYVVKFARPNQLRSVSSDQVASRAGREIDAPVPEPAAIRVEVALLPVGEEPSAAGLAHGCRFLEHVTDRQEVAHVDENRQRFGALTVFYTWLRADDRQVVYQHGGYAGRLLGRSWALPSAV